MKHHYYCIKFHPKEKAYLKPEGPTIEVEILKNMKKTTYTLPSGMSSVVYSEINSDKDD